MTDMKIGEVTKKEGFKIDFSQLNRAKKECELKKSQQECKKDFEKLGIEWYD